MASPTINLDRLKVQTARMMEIYALLSGELEKNTYLALPATERTQLDQAIATIQANMRQLQEYLMAYQEENSPTGQEARELEEILDAVLRWQMECEKGE
jgi:hypothetical protein